MLNSLTSLQQRLIKTGGRLIRHARYFTFAARGKLLDRSPLSSDPRAHRAAGVASDVIECKRSLGGARRADAGVSLGMMFITEEASRGAGNCGPDASTTRRAAGSEEVAIPAACRVAPVRGVRRSGWGYIANLG